MRIALGLVAGFCLVVALACSDDGGSSEDSVEARANEIVLTFFDVFAGKKPPQALVDVYAPECRRNVNLTEITAVVELLQAFLPGLANADIEAVDLGDLNIEETADGVSIEPKDANAMRFRVDGRFVNAEDYLTDLMGADAASFSTVTEGGALNLVRRDGQLYIADCEDLQDITD